MAAGVQDFDTFSESRAKTPLNIGTFCAWPLGSITWPSGRLTWSFGREILDDFAGSCSCSIYVCFCICCRVAGL